MKLLTEDASLVCTHELGTVAVAVTQSFVTIKQRRVLVENNPEQRPIKGCPNAGPVIKPCTTTLVVKQGYSDWIRIGGNRVCLDNTEGLTDGTPPGTVKYQVRHPGQVFVEELP